MTQSRESSPVKVVHRLPRRTRLRVPALHRSTEKLNRLKEAFTAAPGVKSVEINQKTGSVLLHHDAEPGIIDSLSEALEQAHDLLFFLMPEMEIEDEGGSEIARQLHDVFASADNRFAKATDNVIDLKMIVPLLLLTEGVRRMLETRSLLANVSPLILFYYAFDAYLKLHRSAPAIETRQKDLHIDRSKH